MVIYHIIKSNMKKEIDQYTRQLLYKAYEFFNSRDIDGALQLMNENVEWPNGMEGGYVYGRQGIKEYWTRQWTLINPHVEITDLSLENGEIVAHVRATVKDLEGNLLSQGMIKHVYFLKNNLVQRMEIR